MPLSTKTKEHIRRRAGLLLPKLGALAGGGAALAAAIAFTGSALHFVTVSDSRGASVRILTSTDSLSFLLARTGIEAPGDDDKVVYTSTPDGEELQILRGYPVQVTADGQTQEVISTGETPAELLAELGISYDEDDRITPDANQPIPEGSAVVLQRVDYNEYTVDEVIPTEVEEIPSSLMYRHQEDTITTRDGSDGLDTVTYQEIYIDGELSETVELNRIHQVEMQPTLVKVYGEQAPVSSFVGPEIADGKPTEGVAETYTAQRATAYSASATAKGASGRRLTYGTVAVNPNVIPYGTLLYITSDDGRFVYGYAYAADTGTAMMAGHAFIDLYYENYDESVENAVVSVTVYVIDDETAARYQEQNDALLEADTIYGK